MSVEPEALEGIPKPGEVLAGKYEVEGVLGAGGMGVVLAARHVGLGQRVAVKFLLPDVAKRQPEAVERFLREARAATQLKSEHVARVMDVATAEGGAAYLVMEYLEGQDLGRVLQEQGRLPISDVVDYALQAAEALAEAHGRGIAIQLNFLLDQGAVTVAPDGTFAVVPAKITGAVEALTHQIMTLQAAGDYIAAKRLIDTLGVVRPEVQRVLDRLAAVPVDISPRFTSATF